MESRHPDRTVSLPDHQHPNFVGDEAVVGLRIRGSDRCFDLDPKEVSFNIGSARGSDIHIEDDIYVSGIHAVVVRDPRGGLLVLDKSKNGSFVNGVRCKKGHLRVGAQLQVGTTVLVAYSETTRYIPTPFERLAGPSVAIRELREMALSVGATAAHTLLIGEPGSGKRTAAAAIHQASDRATGPYVVVDCDGLDTDEIVPTLLGEDGLGGALADAHRGTLVVHGAEHVPERLFPRLVKALWAPDGTERDLRMIFTCSDAEHIANGDYRWLRDACVELRVPALRDRLGDMPALVFLFLRELSPPGSPKHIPSHEVASLAGYHWPGNVEELRAALRRAIALAGDSDTLTFDLFWPDRDVMMQWLELAVTRAFEAHGSVRTAAESLGMPKSTYARLLKKLGGVET